MSSRLLGLACAAALAACGGGGGGGPGPGPGPGPDLAPAKPTGLVATPAPQQVDLSWTANAEADLAYYAVYESTAFPPTLLGTVAAPAHAYSATGLVNGTTYIFHVKAVDASGQASPGSDTVFGIPNTAAHLVSVDGLSPIVLGTVAQTTSFAFNVQNDGGLTTGPVRLTIAGPDAAFFTTVASSDGTSLPGGQYGGATLSFNGTALRSYSATVTVSATPGGSVSRAVTVTRGYEVQVAWPATGKVVSTPAGIQCGSSSDQCQHIYGGNDWVTLSVTIANGAQQLFTGWSAVSGTNPCVGPSRICALEQKNVYLQPHYVSDGNHNIAFVSSETFATNLTLAEYDAACNRLARSAGLNPSTGAALDLYVAWVSISGASALTRLQAAVPTGGTPLAGTWRGWLRVDGNPLADTVADLTAGRFYYPLSLDEMGRTVRESTSNLAHTDTIPTGAFNAGVSCSTGANEAAGLPWGGPALWTYTYTAAPCSTSKRIYCLMRGRTSPVTGSPAPGKKMWTTSTPTLPGDGLAGLDGFCQTHKPAGVTSAKALAATTTQAAADRLSASVDYVNLAGQVIASGADLKANKLPLATGPWFHEDGTVALLPPDSNVMTGSQAIDAIPPFSTYTCSDWTDATPGHWNAAVGNGTSDASWFYAQGFGNCGAGARLICFEE